VSSTRDLTDQEEYDLALGGAWIAFARLHGSTAILVARSHGTLYDYDEWTNRSSGQICDLLDDSHKDQHSHTLTPATVASFRAAIEDRDSIAHSMVASDSSNAASKLWRYKRDKQGTTVRDQVLTAEWLDSFRRRCRDLRKQVKLETHWQLGVVSEDELERPGA